MGCPGVEHNCLPSALENTWLRCSSLQLGERESCSRWQGPFFFPPPPPHQHNPSELVIPECVRCYTQPGMIMSACVVLVGVSSLVTLKTPNPLSFPCCVTLGSPSRPPTIRIGQRLMDVTFCSPSLGRVLGAHENNQQCCRKYSKETRQLLENEISAVAASGCAVKS